jgi:hypothetical protein
LVCNFENLKSEVKLLLHAVSAGLGDAVDNDARHGCSPEHIHRLSVLICCGDTHLLHVEAGEH